VFDHVQIELERRKPGKDRHSGVHEFSGQIRCGQCGGLYGSKIWHSNSKYRKVVWQCNHKFSGDEKCSTPHLTDDEIKAAFVSAANKALDGRTEATETFRLIKETVLDTSALEQERDELISEINVVAGLIKDGIYQNARVAQDQDEYSRSYDDLTARYDRAKARLDEVTEAIADKASRYKSIENYLKLLTQRDGVLTEFDPLYWHGMVDHVTVYSREDIRFTFKDGTEIKA